MTAGGARRVHPPTSRLWVLSSVSLFNPGLVLAGVSVIIMAAYTNESVPGFLLPQMFVDMSWVAGAILITAWLCGLASFRKGRMALLAGHPSYWMRFYFFAIVGASVFVLILVVNLLDFNANLRARNPTTMKYLSAAATDPVVIEAIHCCAVANCSIAIPVCSEAMVSIARAQTRRLVTMFSLTMWILLSLAIMSFHLIMDSNFFQEHE